MSADHQAHGVTIAEAARHLGISENAIRQRIKRETVSASKVDGVWRVTLSETAHGADHERGYQSDQESRPSGDYEDRLVGDHQPTSRSAVSVSARAQLAALSGLVEEMLAPIIAQHEERTTELARRLGAAEAERDQARAELAALQAEHAAQGAMQPPWRGDASHMAHETVNEAAPASGIAGLAARLWRQITGW